MPRKIDQEALESPNMKILDINNPPTMQMPYEPYPKMVYLHPKDKTKEHRYKVVQNAPELEAAQKQGWKNVPHIPEEAPEDLSAFDVEEYEEAEAKRGPGRPKKEE